jgi:hypothetical protein
MSERQSIFEGLRAGIQSEEEIALSVLFPFRDKFRLLQQLTEHQARAITPWSVLGVFRRKYKSKILEQFQEEHGLNKVALDRKGRLEASEIFAARARKLEDKEE